MCGAARKPSGVRGGAKPAQAIFPSLRETCCSFVCGGRGRESGAEGRRHSGLFESGRCSDVGSNGGSSEMPGAAIIVGKGFGECGVGAPPLSWVGRVVEGGADEWVPEGEDARVEREEPRGFGGLEVV